MKTMLNPGPFVDTSGTRSETRAGVRLAVSLTDKQFEGIKLYAKSQRMPVASAVRQLALLALYGSIQ